MGIERAQKWVATHLMLGEKVVEDSTHQFVRSDSDINTIACKKRHSFWDEAIHEVWGHGIGIMASCNESRAISDARVRPLRRNISSRDTAPTTHSTTDASWSPPTPRGAVRLDLSTDERDPRPARIDKSKAVSSACRSTDEGIPTRGA